MTTFPTSLLVNKLANQLQESGIEKREATAQAWLLVTTLSKKTRAHLIAQGSVPLTQEELNTLATWVKAITHQYKPLAYIIGETPFLELMLTTQPPTLIPRPETEEWVALLIEEMGKTEPEKLRILDLCTGSGCIALALAKAFTASHIWGVDISPQAILLAQENALRNTITNTTFITSDLGNNIPVDLTFDLIVANPPYILSNEFAQLPPHIKEWEDRNALVDNEGGLGITRRLIELAARRLQKTTSSFTPTLMIEIHYRKGKEVLELMAQYGFSDLAVIKDSAGLDRVVRGKISEVLVPL